MENNLLHTESLTEKPKRSQLLTVLCILSFIMCALNILFGVFGIYQSSPEVMQKNIEQVRAIKPDLADQMEDQMIAMENNSYNKIAPYLGFIFTLLSFLGVIMMWHFKKNGFYIYSIAEILPYTSFIFMGKNSLSMMGPPGANNSVIAMIVLVIMVIIDVSFVSLYAKNLKDMQ